MKPTVDFDVIGIYEADPKTLYKILKPNLIHKGFGINRNLAERTVRTLSIAGRDAKTKMETSTPCFTSSLASLSGN